MKTEAKEKSIMVVVALGLAGLIVVAYIITAGIQMVLPATGSPMLETLDRLNDALLNVMPMIAAVCTGILFLEGATSWAE